MKKIIVILLGVLLFFNSSLFVIIYSVRVLGITRDINEKIQLLNTDEISSETVLVKISLNNQDSDHSVRLINDYEVLCNGFMYDIACKRVVNDTLFLFCLQDNEEDQLIKNVTEHYENEGQKNPQMQYFNILFTFLSNVLVPNNNIEFPVETTQGYFGNCLYQISWVIIDIPPPPPRQHT